MNYGDHDLMYAKALATKLKRDEIISSDQLYPCKSCQQEKLPSEFVKHHMKNSYVGRYQFLYECKECKRKRMVHQRQGIRSTVEGALGVIYKQLIQGAKKRDISFNLKLQDIISQRVLQDGKCYYTGYQMEYELSYFKSGSQMEKSMLSISCDRLNNDEGYTKDNIVLCCSVINRMKGLLSQEKFKELCTAVSSLY